MAKNILHIASCEKFIPSFIVFVKENFDFTQHEFLIANGMAIKELKITPNVHLYSLSVPSKLKRYWKSMIKMHQADKVILHSLFDSRLVVMLFFMPWLLKKCYWVIWGGDLYVYQLKERNWKWKLGELCRRPVIKRMGYLVTYIDGDVDLARSWYGAQGKHLECFMYPSNLYKEHNVEEKQHAGINILVGNSADPSNNHLEILHKLEAYKDQDITIYAPLSYGNQNYAKQVIAEGKKRFGERFQPLTDFLVFEEYLKLLGVIDVAIFNHKRQQAMGNIITLLGLGKIVYIRSDVTQWQLLEKHGIQIFDVKKFELLALDDSFSEHNKAYVKRHFSRNNYKNQLRELFS
jgi:hypothetical protein